MSDFSIRVIARSVLLVKAALLLCHVATAQFLLQVSTDKNAAVEDALCMVQHNLTKKEFSGFTDSKGTVKCPFSGACLVQVKKLGYKMYSTTIDVGAQTAIKIEQDDIDMDDVVITGQYGAATAQSSINTVKVIDSKKIEEMGAVTLREVLTNQLNVRISQDNVLGTSASINGISGQNIKILIDGVPVIGRMDGNVDLSQINLSNVERIEIIEGPMSVVYGSDALGGVINLISKRRVKEQVGGAVNTYYESNGTYNIDGRFCFKLKNIDVTATGGRNYFDGYSPNYNWQQRTMQWKPRTQYFADGNVTFRAGQTKNIIFGNLFNETIENRGAPLVTPYSAYGFDEYYKTRRWGLGQQTDVYLKKENQLQFINSFQHYKRIKNTYRKDLVLGNSELTPAVSDHDTSVSYLFLFRGVWTNTHIKKIQMQAGYDFNIETAKGQRLENNLQTIQDYALYYTLQYNPVKQLALKAGVRGTYNTRYGTPVVPSFNLKYDITKQMSLRLSYAHGFRAPSLKELSMLFVDINHNIQGNAKLKAERSHNVQVEFAYYPKVKDFNINIRPSFFFNHLYNMISLQLEDAAQQLYSYINVDRFQSTGFNVNSSIGHKYFDFQVGFAYTGRYNRLTENTQDVPRFGWSPEVSSSLGINIPKIKTTIAAFYKFNGMVPGYAVDADGNTYQTAIQSYSMLDASVTVRIWKDRFAITAGAKNLLNVKNINYNTAAGGAHSSGANSMSVGMGITGFASLKINLANNFKKQMQ